MHPFAVLEFKRRGVLNATEFSIAEKTTASTNLSAAQIQDLVRQAFNRPGANSFYGGNSATVMKQASSYALRHGTQHVALFDWDVLVLVKFVKLDITQSEATRITNGVGEYCETTVIPSAQSREWRSTLLGFLGEAYDNKP